LRVRPRPQAQAAREVADASEAGRTPAENERKVFSDRERLTADTSWIVTIFFNILDHEFATA